MHDTLTRYNNNYHQVLISTTLPHKNHLPSSRQKSIVHLALRVLMSSHNCHHNDFIFEGGWKGFFNFEVATANVEDGSVDFGDPEFVAQSILPIDTMGPLPHKQDIKNPLFPVVFWPFITYVFAGMEESCLGRSLGTCAAGEPLHGCHLWFVRCQWGVRVFLVYFIRIPT